MFVGHYAGNIEWERHLNGDEIDFVDKGETSLILPGENNEASNTLRKGELLVVPKNTSDTCLKHRKG